jgi:predicted component of viral defense system (DUF524 family)
VANSLSEVTIPLVDDDRRTRGKIRIVSQRPLGSQYPLQEIDAREAREWGEERIQLLEAATYDYEIALSGSGLRLRPGIMRRSGLSDSSIERGTICAKSYTGLLPIILEDSNGNPVAEAAVEVRSTKLDYRTHYREMLDFIADRATDLLLELRAPSLVRLSPRPGVDSQTITQRYSFVRHFVGSREFRDAISRIIAVPHERTVQNVDEQNTQERFKPTGSLIRQLASKQPRRPVPLTHPLSSKLSSFPTRVIVPRPRTTVDTAENRFVKFALSSFELFFADMERRLLGRKRSADLRLRREISSQRTQLSNILSHELFRQMPEPQLLPLGSSVLQRRSGYREVLNAWLRFNLAAALEWNGGRDIYEGGRRDVATLYEYWLFFQLLDLVKRKFKIPTSSVSALIEKTGDTLGLKLKSGIHVPVSGRFDNGVRQFEVRFSFNRTFARHSDPSADPAVNYPAPGSWTRRMRPDYTLSLWPAEYAERDAEEKELIVHLHFDAKYRVETISDFFGDDDEDITAAEHALNEDRSTKRDDLLKMHAYRDAIRRSQGAYVLYPGTQHVQWRGFHELLPGIGAFAVAPGNRKGIDELSRFFDDVVTELSNRATQRDRQSYHTQRIHVSPPANPMNLISYPEKQQDGDRSVPPAEIHVLAAWCRSDQEMRATQHAGRFFFRIQDGMTFSFDLSSVQYVLLYGPGFTALPGLMRVTKTSPRLLTGDQMDAQAITSTKLEGVFAVYDLEPPEPEFLTWHWAESNLASIGLLQAPTIPSVISLDLLARAVKRFPPTG